MVIAASVLMAAVAIWSVTQVSPAARTERQVRRVLETTRPTRASLYDYAYAPLRMDPIPAVTLRALAEADYSARQIEDIPRRRRLIATIAIGRADVENAVGILEDLRFQYPRDPGIANDLGVVYLELANSQPERLLDALDLLLTAAKLAPHSPQVAHNVALTLTHLELPQSAQAWTEARRKLDGAEVFFEELDRQWREPDSPISESADISSYARPVSWSEAMDNPSRWWNAVLEQLRNPQPLTWTPSLEELVNAHESYFEDRSVRAILEPLFGTFDGVRAIRKAITDALDEQSASPERTVDVLDSVAKRVAELPANDFDRLRWEIIRSEHAFREHGNAAPLRALEGAVETARASGFRWLYGHGMESLAGALGAGDHLTLINRNQRSFDELASIGASHDALRSRSTLAGLFLLEGDWETSFRTALETMMLASESDHRRRFAVLEFMVDNPLVPDLARLAYIERLLDHAEQLRPADLASALALAARVQVTRGDLNAAEKYILQIREIESSIPLFPPTYFRLGMAEARLYRHRGTLGESLAFFEEATTDLKTRGLGAFTHPIYLEWAESLRQLGDRDAASRALDEALESVERLNDQIGRLHFDPVRRSVYETTIEFHLEANHAAAWETVQRYRTKLDTTILPLFGQTATDVSAPVHIPDIDDRTILEYTVLADRLLIWVIADGTLRHLEVPLDRDDLTDEVQRYLHYIARPDVTSSALPELAESLYQKLIEPVRDWLDPAKPLVIIPDRILHRLPFAALPSPDGRFLVEDFVIAESPTLVRALHDAPAWSETPRMMALGPQYPSVGMKRELDAIGAFYPSIEVMDSQTTRDEFLQQSHGTSMLHVTGHSAVDGASGLTSAILLDGVNGPNRITAADVAGLQLDGGSLVVLASCDSSVGNAIGGIGVRGLTSAFLAAGAGAVAGSLWRVDDEATGTLMTSFHEALIDGETVAGALRQAQLDFIDIGRHPYEWAAFTVTGDRTATRPIPVSAEASAEAREAAAVSP